MASTIKALIDRFYPRSATNKVVISGSDYSGKTSLLYLLKTGELVQTISSIGFNIENVNVPLRGPSTSSVPDSGKKLDLEAWDVSTGCGGMRFLLTYLRWCLPGAKALIWVVDSDRVRGEDELRESADTLKGVISLWDEDIAPQEASPTLPILILANKADLPNTFSLDEVRKAFADATKGQITAVFQTSVINQQGLAEAFEWLNLAFTIAGSVKANPPSSSSVASRIAQVREPSVLAKRLEGWLHRTDEDMPGEEFIAKFNAYDLPSWDHYTHIRLAYLLLMAHGRQKGKDLIFEGLANYIANSAQTNIRGYHCSMTYLWIQMVHFGIRNMPPSLVQFTQAESGQGEKSLQYPSPVDFFRFLLVNPHLADGNLWTDYYSKEVLMSPEAKAGMVLPDKKALPSLVVRDAVKGFGKK